MSYAILTRRTLGPRWTFYASSGFSWFSCRVRMNKESTLT